MQAAVTADAAHDTALLQRLVEQNSGTLNLPGVRAVADIMRAELEPLGFAVRWVDMAATARAPTMPQRRGGFNVSCSAGPGWAATSARPSTGGPCAP